MGTTTPLNLFRALATGALAGAALAFLAACGADQPQSAACQRFVGCVRALDAASGRTTNAVRFEPAGDCWGSPAGAELCTNACRRGLSDLSVKVTNLPPECTP